MIQVGQMQTNCYLIVNEKTNKCLIIDPGDEADYITNKILSEKITPEAIILTHGHFDHTMASFELQINFNIPVYMHLKDKFLIKKMQDTANYFNPNIKCPPPPQKIKSILLNSNSKNYNNLINVWNFKVIKTPGHTPGSISIYFPKQKIIFVGDLIFINHGVGRTDFKYADTQKLQKSIQNILKLPKNILVYPGHGQFFKLSNW